MAEPGLLHFFGAQMGWTKGLPRNKPPWNFGLTIETSEKLKTASKKASATMKGKTTLTDEGRKKLSDAVSANMKNRYASGWSNLGGRCKKIKYESKIAGTVFLDGTWELKAAIYLDSIGVKWKRNTIRFSYMKPSGVQSTYCPDFYVEDWACYVEVKGYETELDRSKWKQFPHQLQIWKREKIKSIGK